MIDPLRNAASTVRDTVSSGTSWGYRNIMSPIIPDFIERRLGLLPQIEAINEASTPDRARLFGEVLESLGNRHFPTTTALYSVLVNIFSNPRESWALENEFEFVTGVLFLMPASVQRLVLRMTIIPMLRTVGLDTVADFAEQDPRGFINRIRIHESDFGTLYTGIRNFGLFNMENPTSR